MFLHILHLSLSLPFFKDYLFQFELFLNFFSFNYHFYYLLIFYFLHSQIFYLMPIALFLKQVIFVGYFMNLEPIFKRNHIAELTGLLVSLKDLDSKHQLKKLLKEHQ